ncbi:MAG: carbon-nitrogen hydrolase family protein [Ignavibacteriae bacterium]|nr:carbon-nitrogen hydrolase family protein [Ignavibacteriota bacterium]
MVIAACQPPDIQNDIEGSLSKIVEYAQMAESDGAALVCYPECFLQGYVVDEDETGQRAIDLSSEQFGGLLKQLSHLKPILVVGLIELEGERVFNSAVVVQQGRLLGTYRKSKLLPREKEVFLPGENYPLFNCDGIPFGINICNDLNYPESTLGLSTQGARLMVCPCNNMLRYQNAEVWKEKHNEIRAQRSVEGGVWLLSSDVTGERDGRISYGPTALIDPQGSVVAQVPLGREGLLIQEIF